MIFKQLGKSNVHRLAQASASTRNMLYRHSNHWSALRLKPSCGTCKNLTVKEEQHEKTPPLRLQYPLYPLQHDYLIHPSRWLTCLNVSAWICGRIHVAIWPSGIPLDTKIGVNILPKKAVIVNTNVAHLSSHLNLQIWTVPVPTYSKVLCLSKVKPAQVIIRQTMPWILLQCPLILLVPTVRYTCPSDEPIHDA